MTPLQLGLPLSRKMWCPLFLIIKKKLLFPYFSCKPHIIEGHKWISMCKEVTVGHLFATFQIIFTYLSHSCHQVANCQTTQSRLMNLATWSHPTIFEILSSPAPFELRFRWNAMSKSIGFGFWEDVQSVGWCKQAVLRDNLCGKLWPVRGERWERGGQINALSLFHCNRMF